MDVVRLLFFEPQHRGFPHMHILLCGLVGIWHVMVVSVRGLYVTLSRASDAHRLPTVHFARDFADTI